ncbi:MAG TPA: DNA-directed RNA polymerase [Candidatus Methanomethylicus sp.]|nr:DNA-directed RNA polymerase [Candidatus Methanomethylicus sp.]HRU81268.1 DNA-directed RNA polymerase [Candidatus Methanomethylicus sp.]
MYKLLHMNDVVRIPPEKFGRSLDQIASEVLRSNYEDVVMREFGIVLAILNVEVKGFGKILPGDGALFYKASFDMLVLMPMMQEVVEGEVVEVNDYGIFVRIGPIDGLVHVSQIMDDYITHDQKRNALIGRESQRIIEKGNFVRARVSTVSLSRGGSTRSKIGMTMRQPFLGSTTWIEADLKKLRGEKAEVAEQAPQGEKK